MTGVELDDPKFIVDGLIAQQRRLLMGFKGSETADQEKFEEAMDPNMAAISLAGEPTLYPDLGDFIGELKRRDFTTFLVTNGTRPDALKNLSTLPYQLYVSIDAPNEQLYKKVDRPQIDSGWASLKETLALLPSLSPRTVLRLTLMRGTLLEPKQYSELIKLAAPDFVECKAYMHVGFSRKRLQITDMPLHSEIVDFSKQISEFSGYEIADQKQDSRVVLLKG
jgi:tRNA wybutosine-synthesizing protein 1